MNPRLGRILFLVAAIVLLSAAAGLDWPTAPAASSPGVTPVLVPANCVAFGCTAAGDPMNGTPPLAVDIGTVFSRASH